MKIRLLKKTLDKKIFLSIISTLGKRVLV